jgi:hypothetical protein
VKYNLITYMYSKECLKNIIIAVSLSADIQMPLTMVNRQEPPQPCPSNKLSKLTLATFDEDGMSCIVVFMWVVAVR